MANTITVYTREASTRKYIPATNQAYPFGTVFCIRYLRAGRRVWETLPSVHSFGEAKHAALTKELELYQALVPPAGTRHPN